MPRFVLNEVKSRRVLRALPSRVFVWVFGLCRLTMLMFALMSWQGSLLMGAIGRKLNYKGGGSGPCFSSNDNNASAEQLPASCVLWLASGPFDDPLLYWAVAMSTLTFCCALIAFFSLDIRNIISDRDFLQLLFKGWPPGQALFLS